MEKKKETFFRERYAKFPYVLWPILRNFAFLDYKTVIVDFEIVGDMPPDAWQQTITQARAEGHFGLAIVSGTGKILYTQSFIGPYQPEDEDPD